MHNNWIIDNHQLINNNNNDNAHHRGSKSKINGNAMGINGSAGGNTSTGGNKSVIIVKPNHGSSSLDVKDNHNKYENKMKDS